MRVKMGQLEWAQDDDKDTLAMARLALRRCRYLTRELKLSLGRRPEVLLRSTKVGGLSGGDVGQVGVAEEPADDVGQLL